MSTEAKKDRELFEQWLRTKDPKHYTALYKQLQPVIQTFKQRNYNPDMQIPEGAYDTMLRLHVWKALRTYDPKKGTTLATHVMNQLLPLKRYIATYQNMSRIPENRIYRIGELLRAKEALTEALGREPHSVELAKYLKWKIKDVDRLSKMLRKDISHDKFPMDISYRGSSRLKYLDRMLKHELSPTDYDIYKGLMENKKAKELAKKLRMSEASISRRRAHIEKVIDKLLEGSRVHHEK